MRVPKRRGEFAAGIAVAVVIWCALHGIRWLTGRKSNPLLCRIAAAALALSVGVSIFVGAYLVRETLGANFRYFAGFPLDDLFFHAHIANAKVIPC
jgi:hypothetical protein